MTDQTSLDTQFAAVGGGLKQGPLIMSPEFSGPDSSIFRPGNVTICSVIPREFEYHMYHAAYTEQDKGKPAGAWQFKNRTRYHIPCPQKDGYSTLTIYDAVAKVPQFESMQTSRDPIPQSPRNIPARTVATDLVNRWGGNIYGSHPDCMPGIGIIAGYIPTEEELAHLKRIHLAWCRKLVNEADALADQKRIEGIGQMHAEALAYTKEERDWKKGYIPRKECIGCQASIYANAKVCSACGQVLPKLALDELGYTPDDVPDKTLVDDMKRLLSRRTPASSNSVPRAVGR